MRPKSEQGFTLVELMIALSIAAILVTLAQPSFQHSIRKAREAVLKQNLSTLREVIDQYRADRGEYPASLEQITTAGYVKQIPTDPFTKSNSTWQEIQDDSEGGIFDVFSGSDAVGLDGTPYNSW
jgi:general secretion pathway protein G